MPSCTLINQVLCLSWSPCACYLCSLPPQAWLTAFIISKRVRNDELKNKVMIMGGTRETWLPLFSECLQQIYFKRLHGPLSSFFFLVCKWVWQILIYNEIAASTLPFDFWVDCGASMIFSKLHFDIIYCKRVQIHAGY